MDIADTLAPKSDQLDGVDLASSGPQTFTITRVVVKSGEQQPVDIHLVEFPRPWRPNKNTRRLIVAAWGQKSEAYVGRRVTLFFDPDVEYGGARVGGVRISAMSNLPDGKPFTTAELVKKGRSALVTVQPLLDVAPSVTPRPSSAPSREQIAECVDVDQLNACAAEYQGPRRDAALARIAALDATPAPVLDAVADAEWLGGGAA